MGALYLVADGLEITRRRARVPAGQIVEAWPDLYVAGDFWLGAGSKALLDAIGPPIRVKLSLESAWVPVHYGPRLRDTASLPLEESLQARTLSARGVGVAWITLDQSGARTEYQPQSPTDPVFFLRRPGGGAVHIWRLFRSRREAVVYMREHYGTDPDAHAWAEALPVEDYEALLRRHGVTGLASEVP